MRILQLCPKPPVPTVDGGTLAMNSVTQGLLQSGQQVKVLTIETDKHPFQSEKITQAYQTQTSIESVYVKTGINVFEVVANLFSKESYNVNRFYSLDFENKLISILQKGVYDIIQLESLYMGPYISTIRQHSKAKVILRAHNVEGQLWERRTLQEKNPLKKSWFKHLTKNLSNYEIDTFRHVDAIIPITKEDELFIDKLLNGKSIPTFVLPFVMELPEQNQIEKPKQGTVFHIGAMDWDSNIEGIKWLTKEVWPLVIAKIPFAELHLAGRSLTTNDQRFSGTNIFLHGEVENAFQFMSSFSLMTVPLLSGGGMRVKLVEGMSIGKPIITTTIGAEGTGTENAKQLMIANSTTEFADAICNLINNEIFAHELGLRSKEYAKTNFDLALASKKLNDFYTSLLT